MGEPLRKKATDFVRGCALLIGLVTLGYCSLVSRTKFIGESTAGHAIYEECRGISDCSAYFYYIHDKIEEDYCKLSVGNRVVGNRCYQGNPNSHILIDK